MEPRPERHPGIEVDHDLVAGSAVAPPARLDDEPAPEVQDVEVLLPRLGPVGLVDDAGPQLADRPQAERLEVAERLSTVAVARDRRRRSSAGT